MSEPQPGQPRLGHFGDRRIAATGSALLTAMERKQTMCLQALADSAGQTRKFNAFLDNEAVSQHEMLVYASRRTASCAAGRHALVVTDTTELNYATHTRKRGFGAVGNGLDIGVFLHPAVALDADHGGILGLVGATVINRHDTPPTDRDERTADEKESRRWLQMTETAGDVLHAAAMITMVEDREGDIYDQFARRPETVHLLVRAAQNRSVGPKQFLFDVCRSWSETQRYTLSVPAKPGGYGKGPRPERTAVVAVRFGEVTLRRPSDADKALPATVTMRVVDVREVDGAADPKEAVHWCLLTTHAVTTAAEAMQVVRWYRLRWTIEQVFRTMKTDGIDVETSQITTPGSLLKLVTVALIAAVQVMQLVIGRDGSTGQPLSDVVADAEEIPALLAINASLEGKTDKQKNPHDPASLAWYAWIAGRLGGWSGYTATGYRPPGPKIMARGLRQLAPMVRGWLLANHSALPAQR
jgi:hypothetical protein